MGDAETELDRALARIKELERENRALWYANGLIRQTAGMAYSAVRASYAADAAVQSDGTEAMKYTEAADKILNGVVGLVIAKE